jgi:membrane-associated phospholipid phosphatase
MKKLSLLFLLLISNHVFAQNFDINTLKELNLNRNRNLDASMQFISNSEYAVGIAAPLFVCGLGLATKDSSMLHKGVNVSVAIIANTGATYLLKRIVNRDRPGVSYPFLQPLENKTKHSFPSGHTSNAFCIATSISLNFRKWYLIAPSYLWASSVGYARMHMGVHYPSDVFAGALLGAGSAWISYQANKKMNSYWIKKKLTKTF